jgi:outer membrane lipoprotein-sorting protein
MMLDDMMSGPSRPVRRRLLLWLLPALAAGAVALVTSGVLSATAHPNLPNRSTGQLLTAISYPKQSGFSGTVVAKASFGLPDLTGLGLPDGLATGGSGPGLLSLLSGTHTARVWYGGPTQQRIALLDTLGELDLFRNGDSLWQWNSDTRTAVHRSLPPAARPAGAPAQLPTLSPDQAAQRILALLQPSTTVSVDRNAQVADRSAYVLVLAPEQDGSLIRQVRISVDGATMVPLAVQIYVRSKPHPVLDVAFTRFTTGTPSADNFDWTPPAGVTIERAPAQTSLLPGLALPDTTVRTIGSGWTSVLAATGLPSRAALAGQSPQAAALLGLLPPVKGSWGSGRLLQTEAFSVLITDDGRVFAGAVEPSVLYRDAAK